MRKITQEMYDYAISNKGWSDPKLTKRYRVGTQVGDGAVLSKDEFKPGAQVDLEFTGIFFDEDQDAWVFDISTDTDSRSEAVLIAMKNLQNSIWDDVAQELIEKESFKTKLEDL